MKPLIVFFYIIIAAIILAECTTQQPTQAASATVTPLPVPSSTPIPTRVPTVTPVPPTPTTQPLPQAIVNVEEFLAKKLSIQAGDIKLVSYSAVEWPDSCLGVQTPGIMCAMHVTPGFKVFLQVGNKVYELHSDQAGQEVLLVGDQPHSETLPSIVWQSGSQACQQVTVYAQKIIFGCYHRGVPGKTVAIREDRAADFNHFTQTFASFSADTPAGQLFFSGQGTVLPTADQQRSIAE